MLSSRFFFVFVSLVSQPSPTTWRFVIYESVESLRFPRVWNLGEFEEFFRKYVWCFCIFWTTRNSKNWHRWTYTTQRGLQKHFDNCSMFTVVRGTPLRKATLLRFVRAVAKWRLFVWRKKTSEIKVARLSWLPPMHVLRTCGHHTSGGGGAMWIRTFWRTTLGCLHTGAEEICLPFL